MARAYTAYAAGLSHTIQTAPIPDRVGEMVANNAGGYGFILDDWERLTRFLILGTEGGTYHIGEHKLTAENAATAIRCIHTDGPRAIEMAREINIKNRAPKTDQQLFVLALAMKHGDEATKLAVAKAAPEVIRIGTHLLHFAGMLDSLGGWNRSKRRILANWFSADADRVAFQMLKYQNRDGWTMRDLLRLSHVKPISAAHDAAFCWAADKDIGPKRTELPSILVAWRTMQMMDATPVERALWGLENGLPREALPTEAVNDPLVQRALLPDMPLHALIRNLGNLTASGVLANAGQAAIAAAKLTDRAALRKARVHPFAIMVAAAVYKTGAGIRGGKTWVPKRAIIEALDDAYEAAYDNVTPTNKRILIAIDGSGSMQAPCMGTSVSCEDAAAMVALVLARTEPHATVVVFEERVRQVIPITKRSSLSSIKYDKNPVGTDLAAPVQWAMGHTPTRPTFDPRQWYAHDPRINRGSGKPGIAATRQEFDAFILISDNETWAGNQHPAQALAQYRREMVPSAKLICCAMAANHANVVDPTDPLQLGFAGLDAALPGLVTDFIAR